MDRMIYTCADLYYNIWCKFRIQPKIFFLFNTEKSLWYTCPSQNKYIIFQKLRKLFIFFKLEKKFYEEARTVCLDPLSLINKRRQLNSNYWDFKISFVIAMIYYLIDKNHRTILYRYKKIFDQFCDFGQLNFCSVMGTDITQIFPSFLFIFFKLGGILDKNRTLN